MTVLSMVNDCSARLSLVQTTIVFASTDKQIIQLAALLNQSAREMASYYPWQALTNEWLFTTTATEAQAALPTDFDRFMNNSTFDRNLRRGVLGPITAQRWQAIKAQPIYNLVYLSYRMRDNTYIMTPTPAAGHTIALEYVSENYAIGSLTGTQPGPKAVFNNDDDTTLLNEEVLTLGLIWRFLRARGLDYAEEQATYERQLERLAARDGGATSVSLTPRPLDPSRINLPDGSFGMP